MSSRAIFCKFEFNLDKTWVLLIITIEHAKETVLAELLISKHVADFIVVPEGEWLELAIGHVSAPGELVWLEFLFLDAATRKSKAVSLRNISGLKKERFITLLRRPRVREGVLQLGEAGALKGT